MIQWNDDPELVREWTDEQLLESFHARANAPAGDRGREVLIDEIERRGIRLQQ